MNLIDAHAHLIDEKFEGEVEKIINNAQEAGVTKIINIGYNKETSQKAIELAEKYDFIYATIGLHPEELETERDITFIKEMSKNKKVVAIGEVGLDYHYEGFDKNLQKEIFVNQIKLANELKLPVVIHSRDADMEMLEILKNNKIENGFVMHCFSSSVEVLKELLKLDAYISLAGPVTFKNARSLIDVAKLIPIEKIMVETDCPYMAPEPYRGKRNEPALVVNTAKKISEIREMNFEEFAQITVENTKRFYKIK